MTKGDTATTVRPRVKRGDHELLANRRAFDRQRAQLMQHYQGLYVALSRGRVVDHDTDDEALAARMFKRFLNAPFYIARVEEVPAMYELPSPELAR